MGDGLQRRPLDALRPVGDELFGRPARRLDPASQLRELRWISAGFGATATAPSASGCDRWKMLMRVSFRGLDLGFDDAVKPARRRFASRPWVHRSSDWSLATPVSDSARPYLSRIVRADHAHYFDNLIY